MLIRLADVLRKFLVSQNIDVVLLDTNPREVRVAHREGLPAISEDAMLINPDNHAELYACGKLLVMTTNQDLNRLVCQRWSELLDSKALYRWEQAGYETDENRHLLVGTAVWGELPLSRWMQPNCGEPPLKVRKLDDQVADPSEIKSDGAHVLLTARDEAGLLFGDQETYSAADQLLVYDLEGGQRQCSLPLVPFNVTESDQTELMELYREMLTHLKKQSINVDPETTLADIWKREEEYTSLLGNGIAMPHYWSPHIERSILMVTRPSATLRCPLTDRPIELVFLLLSPTGDPKAHLEHLSYIARLIGSESRRKRLVAAKDSGELYELIVSV